MSMSIIDLQEPVYREEHEIDMLTKRVKELEANNDTCWHKLFGTPEKAARTLTHVCQFTHGGEMCDRCRLYVFNECDGTLRIMGEWKIYDALLEWLKGEAEVIDEPDTIRNELTDSGLLRGDTK